MQGKLFDGHHARGINVTLHIDGQTLFVKSDEESFAYPIKTLRFSDRLGNIPRTIYLDETYRCEVKDNDAVDTMIRDFHPRKFDLWLHHLESKMRYFLPSLLLLALFTYGFFTQGLPFISKQVAFALPQGILKQADEESLALFDRTIFEPSTLSTAQQKRLKSYFTPFYPNDLPPLNLQFRSAKESVGANAFALPNGTIVFTDELVEMAKNDQELLSIFLHEIGHIHHRHALRSILQNSTIVVITAFMTGDISGASSVLVGLPTLLLESNYSRQHEIESDHYAHAKMQEHGIQLYHFAHILERITKDAPQTKSALTYISTHPATLERTKLFKTEK
jgi:Zn-dependent protease with chaperone function